MAPSRDRPTTRATRSSTSSRGSPSRSAHPRLAGSPDASDRVRKTRDFAESKARARAYKETLRTRAPAPRTPAPAAPAASAEPPREVMTMVTLEPGVARPKKMTPAMRIKELEARKSQLDKKELAELRRLKQEEMCDMLGKGC